MSARVFVISDLHFGHRSLAMYNRNFQDDFYHDEHIIDQWNRIVSKRDVVWILGDITMEKKSGYKQLDRLMGHKKVILGNHDRHQDVTELLKHVDSVRGPMKYKGMWFTHIPMHPQELYNKKNVHGHIHENFILTEDHLIDDRYINVCAEILDYKPKLISEL